MSENMQKMSEEEFRQHCNDSDGFCTACEQWTGGDCEPDAREYECEGCGERKVYGAEEILLMGLIRFT